VYRYQHFSREVMLDATTFRSHIGTLPQSPLVSTEEQVLFVSDLLHSGPLLIVCASITCPMASAAVAPLRRLYRQHRKRVRFVTLYTREAHPGVHYTQPDTMQQKLTHARAYKERDRIPWLVAVDDLDGTFHRDLDPKPNAAYFLSAEGRIVFRVLWASDVAGMKQGFARLLSDKVSKAGSSETKILPMMRGLCFLEAVLRVAGRGAPEDFQRTAPLAYAIGRLVGLCVSLPSFVRTALRAARGWLERCMRESRPCPGVAVISDGLRVQLRADTLSASSASRAGTNRLGLGAPISQVAPQRCSKKEHAERSVAN
jgi:hypothetical protein